MSNTTQPTIKTAAIKLVIETTIGDFVTETRTAILVALKATGHRIIAADGTDETEAKVREITNNLIGGMVLLYESE